MESYSNLQAVEEEKIATMDESFLPSDNQSVLNQIGEDANGSLTYKGIPVSGDNYKTLTLYAGDVNVVRSDYGVELVIYNPLPIGTEIKTIRFEYDGRMIDIKNLTAIDSTPYTLHMGQVYQSPTTGEPVLAFIGNFATVVSGEFIVAQSFIISAIESYEIAKIEIDYYV